MNIKKVDMPVEHYRNLNSNYSTIGCFKYLPLSIHTFLRTVPMPWEDKKRVKVLYHTNGNISFILDKTKISEYDFYKKWEETNIKVREFKDANPDYQLVKYPIFGDDEEVKYESDPISDLFLNNNNKKDNNGNNKKDNNDNDKDNNDKDNNNGKEYLKYLYSENDNLIKSVDTNKKYHYDISLYKNLPTPKTTHITKQKSKTKKRKSKFHTNILHHLKNTRFFQTTTMDWKEAGLLILKQGHKMLSEILIRKKLHYLVLDKNFNLKITRPLKTKERKKSRLGTSFHLTRELLKLLKNILDLQITLTGIPLVMNMHNLFTKVGVITGIYRYKYKVMTQIKICKDVEKILVFYNDYSWSEMWRRYVFMTRGYNSLLKEYISNITERIINGREYKEKKVTKQRKESNFDIEIKNIIIEELEGLYSKEQIKMILRHFNEAWRCWKGDKPRVKLYDINEDDVTVSQRYISNTNDNDTINIPSVKHIDDNDTINIPSVKLINENNTINIPSVKHIDKNNSINIPSVILKDETNTINIPSVKLINENNSINIPSVKHIDEIIDKYISIKSQWYIKEALNPTINSKKDYTKHLGKLTRLYFKDEKYRQDCYLQNMSLTPLEAMGIYKTAFTYFNNFNIPFPEEERHFQNAISYLLLTCTEEEREFYESLSPSFIFNIKKNILTQRKFRGVEARICNSYNEYVVTYKVNYLERLTDAYISSYLFYESSRMNIFPDYVKPGDEIESLVIKDIDNNTIMLEYKDLMSKIDNNLLSRLLKIFIDPSLVDYIISRNNIQVTYKDMSYTNHIGFLNGFQFSAFIQKFYTFVIDLVVFGRDNIVLRNINTLYINADLFDKKRNSSYDVSTVNYDVITDITPNINNLSILINSRLPRSIGNIIVHTDLQYEGVLINNLSLSKEALDLFKWRIKQIIKLSGSSTFIKTISKWNNTILGFVSRYREYIRNTPEIEDIFTWAEKSIQSLIKKGINSKMPARFPAVLFYTPVCYGGLGMYSVMRYYNSDINNTNVIPSILDYIKTWEEEYSQSNIVWSEFTATEKIVPNSGIPRMSTLLQKDKISFFDRDFRLQSQYRRFISPKYDPFIFTSMRHDGRLYDLEKYTEDMIEALGGVENILQHTIFHSLHTNKMFNKIFWSEEETRKDMTRAQKSGLSQIPNRRYILWWSPTINTTDVYVGYQVQLEKTGIFMHGKLPTLKISFIQIFRNNLWSKIQTSLVEDLSSRIGGRLEGNHIVLEGNFYVSNDLISIKNPSNDLININNSSNDLISIKNPSNNLINIKIINIHLVLRWGDYNKNDPYKYAKVQYTELQSTNNSNLLVVVFDLCYNKVSYYGYYDSSLNFDTILPNLLTSNLSLHILRERLRKTLEIYSSEVETVVSSKEMFFSSLIVYAGKVLIVLDPESGNVYYKEIKSKKLEGEGILELARKLNKENVLVKRDMYDSLEGYLIDYKGIRVKIYENNLKLNNIFKMTDTSNIINVYKNWFGLSPFTKFCRLVLLIQAYDLIQLNISFNNILSDQEWILIEKECKEAIINDYCSKRVINKHKLLTTDIRDIVFGFENKEERVGVSWEDKYFIMSDILATKSSKSKVKEVGDNIIRIFNMCTDINTPSFTLLIDVNNTISILFVPQFSTGREIHFPNKFIPYKVVGLIINITDQNIIESIISKYKIRDPIIVIGTNKGNKKKEGLCFSPEKWNYNFSRTEYDDNMEYKIELRMPEIFYYNYRNKY